MQKTERGPVLHFSKIPEGSFSRANVPHVPNVYAKGIVLYPAKIDIALGTATDIQDFGPRYAKAELTRLREIELGMTIKKVKERVRQELFGEGEDAKTPLNNEKIRLMWNDLTKNSDEHLDPDTKITNTVKNTLVTKVARQDPAFIQARNELVQTHYGIVKAVASKYRRVDQDRESLEEEGYEALIRCAERYDWEKGYFRKFAFSNVEGRIKGIIRYDGLIRIPEKVADEVARVRTVSDTLTAELGSSPNIAQITNRINGLLDDTSKFVSEADILNLVVAQATRAPVSLEMKILHTKNDTLTLGDTIAAAVEPFEEIIDAAYSGDDQGEFVEFTRPDGDGSHILFDALSALGPKEHEVIYLHFMEAMDTKDIAAHLSVTPATVQRRIQRAKEVLGKKIVELDPDTYGDPPKDIYNKPEGEAPPKQATKVYDFAVTVRFDPSVIRKPLESSESSNAGVTVPATIGEHEKEPLDIYDSAVKPQRRRRLIGVKPKPQVYTEQPSETNKEVEGLRIEVDEKSYVSISVILAQRPYINRSTMKRWLASVTHLSGYGNNGKTFLYDETEALAAIDSKIADRIAPKHTVDEDLKEKRNYTRWYSMNDSERRALIEEKGRDILAAGKNLYAGKFNRVVSRYYPGGLQALQIALNDAIIAA